MNKIVIAHTPITMDDGEGNVVLQVNVGDKFPARIGGSSLLDMLMGLDEDTLIVDFGEGEAAYSIAPDAEGLSYATWFDLEESA